MKYLELEAKIISKIKTIDNRYIKAFLLAFGLINLAFLFHSINFMYGDHDWYAVRGNLNWADGLHEGRPLHFILQSFLFNGQILPILNNFVSFGFLALGGILLARYWKIPLTTLNYTLFATFVAVLPYTMVWLFYAKDTLINLSLPCIVVLALSLAKNKKISYQIGAFFLFVFAFSSYVAVINLIGVCIVASMIIDYINEENISIVDVVRDKFLTIVNVLFALIFFKVLLMMLPFEMSYNTKIIPLDYLPTKIIDTVNAMFKQFVVILPFMELKFKLALLVVFIFGLGAIIFKIKTRAIKLPILILMILTMLFVSKFAYFIADERGEILTQLENYAFVPRLDFYGLVYIYAFAVAVILSVTTGKFYKISTGILIALTFMSMVRDMYAQKVWKFGFDAEMKANERIMARIEQIPEFDINRNYRILQIGSLSLRKNFYRTQEDEEISLDLLSTSFTPKYRAFEVFNFNYPKDIFVNLATKEQLSVRGWKSLIDAQPWPHKSSTFIDGDIVVIVLEK